jgi:CHRD domain
MKRLAMAVIVLAIGVAGCGDDSPTNPSADLVVFTVPLSALNEVPAITNAESTARGTAVITFNKANNMIDFEVSLNSFPAGSQVNIAHIHGPAPAGVNATILVNTGLVAGNVTLTNGAGTFRFPSFQATAAQVTSILAAPANHYFNVHTTLNPGGAVRGQLQ